MTQASSHRVTPAQWLAVLAVWGLAAYGALAPRTPTPQDQVHLIACR